MSNIKGELHRDTLRAIFESIGPLTSFETIPSKGIAFIEFETPEHARTAASTPITYNESVLAIEARRYPSGGSNGGRRGGRSGFSGGARRESNNNNDRQQ